MIRIDKDGGWEVFDGARVLVEPSVEFEDRRSLQAIESAKAGAERDAVQAERDRFIAYLKGQQNLDRVSTRGFSVTKLEMSFEDVIESVRANRKAELRGIEGGK